LTGQLVWPGAMLLNEYLSKNVNLLQGCTAIELGSGVGMYIFTFKSKYHFLYLDSLMFVGETMHP